MKEIKSLFNSTETIKVIHEDRKRPENQRFLDELDLPENQLPCGITTEDGKAFGVRRVGNYFDVINLKDFSSYLRDSTVTLKGCINAVKERHKLKDVYLFTDYETLVKWSRKLKLS